MTHLQYFITMLLDIGLDYEISKDESFIYITPIGMSTWKFNKNGKLII